MDKDPTSTGARPEPDGASTLDLSGRCVGSSYILVRPIGQGATGTVWRGVDRASGEPVAVKLLHESLIRQPKLVTRFVQERTILLMLRHRNVVRVRDLFSVGESLGLVMDLVPGGSLREHLRRHPVAAGEAARLAAQVAAALAEAHDLGVIHRDLKPDNILLCTVDGRLDTRLTDFGIARVLNTPALTTPNAVVGTPHYMSPEAFHGAPASPAADVYALGILLYELVVGLPPYRSDSIPELMRLHLQGEPDRPEGIPDAYWDLITACLQRKPRLRPSAAELIGELEAVARSDAPALPRVEDSGPVAPAASIAPAGPIAPRAAPATSIVPAPREPRRPHNKAPNWRWARPGPLVALIAGTMLASGVATTAWHMGRADGTTTTLAVPTASLIPSRSAAAARTSPPAPAHATTAPVAATAAAGTVRAATPSPVRATTRPAPRQPQPEARPYGPWQCEQAIVLAFPNPTLGQACHSTGAAVQMAGKLTAGSGQATISVALQENGRTVNGPHSCSVRFDGDASTRECGPHTAAARRGHRYRVVTSWSFTRDGRVSTGAARGNEFTF